jgi:small GTP-binding protein
MAFLDEGRLLASLSETSALLIWQTDTWDEVAHVGEIGILNINNNITSHPSLPLVCTPGQTLYSINIWNLNVPWLHNAESTQPTIHYVNAKAVLLGDSSVGKSGLGIRIAERTFRKTESTHGAQFWHMPVKEVPGLPQNLQAELTLWDLAGQAEYRLIHQLFLDDTDAAMLLFDCSDHDDPFHGVLYWAKVLKKQAPPHAIKFLVSARCDVSPVTVDMHQINQALAKYELQEYFRTSAKEGDGVDQLFQQLLKNIPWQQLPRTSTPRLFQTIRDFLLKCKEDRKALIAMDVIKTDVSKLYTKDTLTQREIDIVVGLLQARGLIYQLEPRPSVKLILTRPELVNQYASSVIQAARNHPFGIGAISERNVLIAEIPFVGFERLPLDEEKIVLEATAELLIRHDLCFREMGLLVFPSQINITRPKPAEMQLRTEVAYRFSGSIETIYASLVVRLSYTDYFHREDQWKYAVEFSRSGARLGFAMHSIEEGTSELEIYFHSNINEFDKVTFIRFVTDHLRAKGIDIHEEIRLYCPKCNREIKNRDAIEVRIKDGFLDIPCQYCASTVLISKSIEERYKHDIALIEKQSELAKKVGQRTEEVVSQFKVDQEQYSQEMDHRIHILHLSDLHLRNAEQAEVHRTQLETDLIQELKITRLEYLVISGDIGNGATEEEYKAAFQMLDNLVKHFGLDADHVILVPGNHDMDRRSSRKAYPFTYREDLTTNLVDGKYIEAGREGVLLCDDDLYKQRFANFNAHFYKRARGIEYPLDYGEQATIIERPEDRILFLGLNSSWEIDHHFKSRASINRVALSKALDYFNGKEYVGWLKIAVFHHPITSKEMMNDEFMQLLAVQGFQICMHGHVHESLNSLFNYDMRGIRVISAGTFGAPSEDQVAGIPFQYNLLTFDPSKGEMAVSTRKKEKQDGSWSADSRWGDKNDPKPYYSFQVQNYRIHE